MLSEYEGVGGPPGCRASAREAIVEKAFCAACGIEVEVVYMSLGTGVSAAEVARCPYCGFTFPSAATPGVEAVIYDRVAVADDVGPVRAMVARALVDGRLARTVDQFADGAAFVRAAQAMAAQGERFELAILDLNMPVFDGLKAALALRQLERRLGWAPTPLLFFSGMVIDERLKGHLDALAPGFYLNKAGIQDEAELGERLRAVLRYLAGLGA
jgi:CheY-like chemotaxis protein